MQSDFTHFISFDSHNMVNGGVQGKYSCTQWKKEEPKPLGHNQDQNGGLLTYNLGLIKSTGRKEVIQRDAES